MFETLLVQPIYNVFIAIVGVVPHGDAGLAIIVLTFITRIVLYPVFTASIRTQMGMAAMQPELEGLKDKHKNDKEGHARAQMELFKKHKVNPLAGFGALFLQLAVIIALYFAIFREGFPAVDATLLYSFISAPAAIATDFFGLVNLLEPKHIGLALLVGITQYLAIRLTIRHTPNNHPKGSDKEAIQRMQQNLMLYMMPVVMTVTAYFFAAAVGIYFAASNVFSLGQEWLIRRQLQREAQKGN
jgi:YidC/Oxa1 family membrane protein insertase